MGVHAYYSVLQPPLKYDVRVPKTAFLVVI